VHDPYQHVRCDFAYAEDDFATTGIYMIWPEFENEHGVPYQDGDRIPRKGTATMWIVSDTMREKVHAERILPGVLGHFVYGSLKVADVEVTAVMRVSEYRVRG